MGGNSSVRRDKSASRLFLGIPGLSNSAARRTAFVSVASLSVAIILALSLQGCGPSTDQKVSSNVFLSPVVSQIRVLTEKLDFLRAIFPSSFDADLQSKLCETYVLGHLAERDDPADTVATVDDLLTFEVKSKSLLGVNMCPGGTSAEDCGAVTMHYTQSGMDDAQSSQGGITLGGSVSLAVPSIRLKSGWILSYDSSSKNIIAFRKEAPRRVEIEEGVFETIGYRAFAPRPPAGDRNFGQGNGLVLSLVITGQQLAIQTRVTALPVVTRMFEIEENKVLLFFSTIQAVHLLDLREERVDQPWDLNDSVNAHKRLPVDLLRGTIRRYLSDPNNENSSEVPFLPFSDIQILTGNPTVKVDSCQPITIPDDGSALVFEQSTSQFFRVWEAKRTDPGTGEEQRLGGELASAIRSSTLLAALATASGGNVTPPLTFDPPFLHPTKSAICLFEEATNSGVLYDYTSRSLGTNLSVFVRSSSVLQPRISSGLPGPVTGTEPVLRFAIADVTANRLTFDAGEAQLLGVNYPVGQVVVSGSRSTLTQVTGGALLNITYIEPVNGDSVRSFDTLSNMLLDMTLTYLPYPVTIQ